MAKNSRKDEIEVCEVPRWQQIKASLHNLNYQDFITSANKAENAILIDVRTPQEFEQNHIPGAINLNYLSESLADDLEQFDSKKHYFIYCRTGRRSLRVCVIMRNLGFQNICNLEDGIVSV